MDLKDYLKLNPEIKIDDLAKNLGVHRNHISGIIHKRRIPSSDLARKIIKLTNDQVQMDDLIPKQVEICPCCKRKLPRGFILSEHEIRSN